MGLSLFKIVGEIFVDDKQALDAMNNIDNKAEDASKNGLTKFTDIANGAGKALLAIGGVAVAGATALIAMGEKSADTAASVKKLSTATQMNLKDTQEWSYVFQKMGSSTDVLSDSVLKLGINMAKGDEGSKKITGAFKDLGIETTNSNGTMKKSSDLFGEAMTKLSGMTDVTERNRQAQLLFGGSYSDLLPILNKGTKGIDDLKKKSEELGKVMSDDQVVAGAKYKKAMSDLKEEFGSITTKLGTDMLPYFGKFADWLTLNSPKITTFVDNVVKVLGDAITVVANNGNAFGIVLGIILTGIIALNAIKTVQELMVAWNTVVKIATGIQEAWNLMMSLNPIALVIIAIIALIAIGVVLYNKCEGFRTGVNTIFNGIKELFTGVLMPYFSSLVGIFTGIFDSIWNSISKVFGNIKNIFNDIITFVKDIFTGNWSGAWKSVVDIFSNIFDGIGTIFKAPLNAMISGINGFLGGISKIKIPDWVPLIGGKGFDIPQIPMLAKGTDYFEGGMAIVGEQGPELVQMPKGSKVNTNAQTKNVLNSDQSDKPLQLYLIVDGKELGSILVPHLDNANGTNIKLKARGLVV